MDFCTSWNWPGEYRQTWKAILDECCQIFWINWKIGRCACTYYGQHWNAVISLQVCIYSRSRRSFGKGIHNVLEAVCWAFPLFSRPNHKKFREAVELISLKAAGSFNSFDEFSRIVDNWLSDSEKYLRSSVNATEYVKKMRARPKKSWQKSI